MITFGGIFSSNALAQAIRFSVPNKTVVEKDTFQVVLNVDSMLTGRNIYAYKFGITYNSSYNEFIGIDSIGSILKNWGAPTVNATSAGTVVIAGAGSTALSGKGGFIYFRFRSIRAGGTYIDWNSSLSMLNEGDPALTYNRGYINATAMPFPDIWPDNAEIYVGQTVQMNSGSGTAPYTYGSMNNAIATVNPTTGLVKGVSPGTTKISVTDAKANVAYTTGVIDVRGVKLSIQPTGALPGDTFYLPIKIEIAPGTQVYSGSFELTFNGNLQGTKSLIEAVDYPVSLQSNGEGTLVKISFATSTPLSGNGILCRVALKAVNTGTHTVNFQNVLMNENLKAFVYSGTVGVQCQPTTKVTGLLPENGAVNQNPSFNLYWQPAVNVRYYNLFLWEDGATMPASPYRSYIYGTNTWLSDLIPGKTYKWKIASINDCSSLESDVQSFTVRNFPDLIATDVQTSKNILSGSQFDVTFTVKNQGQESTGATLWRDMVYISTDSSANGAKTQLMAKYNLKQLAVNETYTQTYTIGMPTEYSGKYYIFVRTDVYNELAELNENNNQSRFADSITVVLKPFPDIKVKDINVVGSQLVPGDSLTVNWKVENIGNADALGGWSERITLVPDNGQRILLNPYPVSAADLPVNQTINRSFRFRIPDILRFSGNAKIEVSLVPSASLVEFTGTAANNTALSASSVTVVNRLFMSVATNSLSEGSTAEVRCVVTRSGDFAADLPVTITNIPGGQINIPASVTINANASSAIFNLTAIDNTIVEGPRNVKIKVTATAHRADSANLQILDNEATVIKAKLNKAVANEGDTLSLRISRNLVTNMPLQVVLSTNRPTQWQFVNAATIPANDSVVTIPVYVFNDKTPELTEDVKLTISSGGFVSGEVICTINDDDVPQLELTLTADTVPETSGVYACYATIKRLSGEGNITVNFSTSVADALILPASVTIPSGRTAVQFNVGVVDNGEVDGYRPIVITGAVYLSSCGCNSTIANGGVVTKTLVIADNDGPALSAVVNPVSVFEGRENAGKLIITRNTGTTGNLVVNISHNDPTEIVLPTSAAILNGQKSVEVPINTINDGIEDGTQMVSISVQANGFISGFCSVYVTDLNKPDFVLHNVKITRNNVLTNDTITVSGTLVNQGYLNAPMGSKVGFYLSKDIYLNETDDQSLGQFQTSNQIVMGDSVAFSTKLKMPIKTGKYYLLPHANPLNVVSELVYTNNTFMPIPVVVQPEYSATAIVDIAQTLPDKPITIHGKATKINGLPAADSDVDVYLLSNGTRKTLVAKTDASGNYSIDFNPLPNESGHYDVGACYPDEGLTDIQDAFDILGFKRTGTDYIIWMTKVGDPLNGTLTLKNNSNVALNNVKMSIVQLPDGCTLTPQNLSVLPGNAVVNLNYTVLGTKRTLANDYLKLKIILTADEGVSVSYDAFYFCQEQEAILETNPSSLLTTVSKGSSKLVEFTLFNKGAGESGKIIVSVPAVNYMTLVSTDTIPNLKTGENATITLKLTDNDLLLNTPVNGSIAFNCEHGKGILMPYKIEAVSNAKGLVQIDVVDEYTYNTNEAPHVQNAHVTIKHPFSGVTVAEGFTGADGIFTTDSIPEGYYTMTIQADKHEGYRNNIVIDGGKTLEQTIFISFQAISYTWEVVRTEIEDEYKIDLIMKFETNVPAPVVVMEMPDKMPHLVNDETYPFMVTLTNKGLITATDVTLTFPEDPEYEFVTNFTTMDLLAQQSIQVPVVMKRKAGYTPVPGLQKAANSGLTCFNVVIEGHAFYCGPDKKWHTGAKLFSFSGRVCVGSPGGGGGYGPGGGGYGPSLGWGGDGYVVPSSNSPTVSVTDVKECDNCLMDLALAIAGCLAAPEVGAVINTAACLKSFADGISAWDVATCLGGYIFSPVRACILAAISALKTCFIDEPFWKSPPSMPMYAAGLNNAKKQVMPPIIKQAASDLMCYLDAASASRNWIDEFTGNPQLFERINFADFIHEVDSFTIFKRKIQAQDIININQKLYGTDILPEEVEAFANRWNQTLEAHKLNIFVPNAQFPDIINDDLLKEYVALEDSATRYALNRGYTSITQMTNTAFNTLKEQVNTGKSSVCASITIKISQKLTMTREAFEGTLTIENGNTQTAMTKIKLNLEVKNSQGVLCNDLFQINTKALSILTGIDGEGELGPQQKGSASILFIPERGAAPQVPTSYSFGGSFSYVDPFTDLEVTRQLFPVTLDVNPSPDLFLHYFMQRDILGDDALTEAIEPVIPAELALMIQNNGYGQATKVRVESAQPEIIENEKGLAIKLALIGSNLNGQERQLGLTNIDFGNIPAKSTAIGQWWFTSSLMGHFINYETRVVHSNSFGNPDLSLVSGATLHELIKSMRVYSIEDGINDFLVNEVQDAAETPDAIYTSQGAVLPVAPANNMVTYGNLSAPDYQIELHVSPKLFGWNYGKVADPTGGRYKIESITRMSDNKALPLDNIWQTHVTMPDGKEPVYENLIHFVDEFAAVQLTKYIIKFVPRQVDPPVVLRIENIPTSVTTTRVLSARVVFEKAIDNTTFTWEDMKLYCQNGPNLMNNTVSVTQINSTTYDVDLSSITIQDGFYMLTIETTDIKNLMGESGYFAKQASWSQFANTPAVAEFIGLPENNGVTRTNFSNIMIRFTVPVDTLTFRNNKLIWKRNGSAMSVENTITRMDAEAKLFKISGLDNLMTDNGTYELTVDLVNIKSRTGVFGYQNQSVSWRFDTKAPEIRKVTLINAGGYDFQHNTSAEVVFSEPVTGFGLAMLQLWRDTQQQPVSQLNTVQLNDTTFRVNDFRLLTYYEGMYSLKFDLSGIADIAGNNGAGIFEKKWTVNRTVPAAVSELKIAPDFGFSATDGVTSTSNLNVSMKVNHEKARVRLYYSSFGNSILLLDTLPASTGLFTVPLNIPVTGSMKLQAQTVDTLGNTATTEVPLFIDLAPLSASWANLPAGGLQRKHPNSVTLNFSEKLLNENIIKDNLECKLNGVLLTGMPLVVTKNNDTQFTVSNFGSGGVAQGGAFSIAVSTANLKKYLSGGSGTLSPSAQWTLRGNKTPVAYAGTDQLQIPAGALIMLDGNGSTDPDNDALTYKWTAPEGVTLSSANIARPTINVPYDGRETLTFSLVVNDGVIDSEPDEVVIHVILTKVPGITLFKNNITLAPNPSNGEFVLHLKEAVSGQLNIRIYNTAGQLVYSENRNSATGIMNYKIGKLKLAPGMYMVDVRLDDEKPVGLEKLVIVEK